MKKILIIVAALIFLLIAAFIFAIYYSFTTVKPTTEQINQDLASYFSRVVYIPKGIPPPIQGFEETIYFWEMETLEKEVVGVRLKHNTAFEKNQKVITLTLEMEEKGDPSIFNKVMPAVIADQQSLSSAREPEKANLSANEEVGYNGIKLSVIPERKQTTQVIWEFEKSNLPEELKSKFKKLENLPALGFLYSLPHFILSLFSG